MVLFQTGPDRRSFRQEGTTGHSGRLGKKWLSIHRTFDIGSSAGLTVPCALRRFIFRSMCWNFFAAFSSWWSSFSSGTHLLRRCAFYWLHCVTQGNLPWTAVAYCDLFTTSIILHTSILLRSVRFCLFISFCYIVFFYLDCVVQSAVLL